MPKVSVIIPVYNAQTHLRRCLDSIAGQTLRDIEIICVDDASTDNSLEILQEYAAADSRFRVLQQPNAGAGAARNHGLKYASGTYLSILDADDFFEPEMLETAYNEAMKHDAQILVFGCDHYTNDSGKFFPCKYSIQWKLLPKHRPFAATDVQKDIFRLFVGWSWDKLFRMDFIRENNLQFQVQRTTNDMLFVFSALVRAERIMVIPEIFVHYRREAGTLSVTREKSWHCFYDALIALRKQLRDWELYDRFERDYINYCVHFSLWNLNTLKEPTRTLLYNMLRDEWYKELGVQGKTEDYFYSRREYRQYQNICRYPADRQKKRNLFLRGWDCLRDNGLSYTVWNLTEKVKKKVGKNP